MTQRALIFAGSRRRLQTTEGERVKVILKTRIGRLRRWNFGLSEQLAFIQRLIPMVKLLGNIEKEGKKVKEGEGFKMSWTSMWIQNKMQRA